MGEFENGEFHFTHGDMNGVRWINGGNLQHLICAPNNLNEVLNIEDLNSHGTFTASLFAANAGTNALTNENDWGMMGVNTISEIVVMRAARDRTNINRLRSPNELAEGLYILAHGCEMWGVDGWENGCDVINLSFGSHGLSGAWEAVFARLIQEDEEDENFNAPLIVVSSGNDGEEYGGVCYPARYAFWGSRAGYEKGYPIVISVGLSDEHKEKVEWSGFTPNHNYVSVVAPGYCSGAPHQGILCAYLPEGNFVHWYATGTSVAAPLVAGVASLVFSAEPSLRAWEVRRIIEKTARDVNANQFVGFDEEIGYGLITCRLAVNNRDFYQWELDDNTWYFLSSNVNPVGGDVRFCDIRRIMEDITVDNADYDKGLLKLKAWDPIEQTELIWQPGVQQDNIDWNVQQMIKVKLNDNNKFTIHFGFAGNV